MPRFLSDAVEIDYLDEGDGPLVILVHGFASNRVVNWVNTNWVRTLVENGKRVVALDQRGHGRSQKLYDSALYDTRLLAGDVVRLMDHLGAHKVALMGYSMGARVSAFTALEAPDRLSALVLSGLASNLVDGLGGASAIAQALRAPSVGAITDMNARAFRVFAEQTGSDREALAACILAARQTLTEEDVATIDVPTLVVAGENDTIAGSADRLASMIPGARAVTLPRRDHMTAVGDRLHKSTVVDFLDGVLR